jgi:carbon storage regulator
MLVLSRKIGETIVVPDCDLTITVVKVKGHRVRLGFSAPKEVAIQRKEISQPGISGGVTAVSHDPHPTTRVSRHPR